VRYFGLIILTKGISMDVDKVQTLWNWSQEKRTKNGRLNNLSQVQQFLGFSNYYGRRIPKYSEQGERLTRLTKMDDPFVWEAEQWLAFKTMLTAFATAPVLQHSDHEREVIIVTDVSYYVSAGVLSQYDDEGVLHPVAYFSKKHTPAECNYDIYDKDVMVIIKTLEEGRSECKGASYPLQRLPDHQNFEYFMTKKRLNRRQAWWSQILTTFEYQIVYRPGISNRKADALTRRPGDLPEGGDQWLNNME